jgi:type III pantothenate kinase
MIVAIDSGNTTSKVGVFKHGAIKKTYEKSSYPEIIRLVLALNPDQIIVGSVNFPLSDFSRDLPGSKLFLFDRHTPIPLRNLYKTPDTLGVDRLALAAGGWTEFPGRNLLIIDAGTCITYDFVNEHGDYLGGGISPGLQLRLRSLHDYTAKLPLVKLKENPPLIGSNTEDSVLSGIVYGTLAEISGIIDHYSKEFKDIQVIFSGGNVKFFESRLKGRIFALPNLVLKGLYSIFLYNERQS